MTYRSVENMINSLREGGVVIFPTDTVWGIGAWIDSKKGIEKLYKIKKRDVKKPTAVLVGGLIQARKYGDFSERNMSLVEKHWPGALTVIVPASKLVPKEIISEVGGVGIRWPKWSLVEQVCCGLGGGIVASSANFSGDRPPGTYNQLDENIKKQCDLVVRTEVVENNKSSTIINLMDDEIKIIRQGGVFVGSNN